MSTPADPHEDRDLGGRGRRLRLPGDAHLELRRRQPRIMGVVNTNPDSFSDATRLTTAGSQIAAALDMVEAGADVIDVGVESGVTYRPPEAVAVQIERMRPVVTALVERGVVVSVDTYRPQVAEVALDLGAMIINDPSGLVEPELAQRCAAAGAALVLLHTRARPREERWPDYDDVTADVVSFLSERVSLATSLGVHRDRLLLDVGIDYAKTPAQSVEVLQRLDEVAGLGLPLLHGISRKYVLGTITGQPPERRLASTLALLGFVRRFGGIVRVHDVGEVSDYLRVAAVLDGDVPMPPYRMDDDALKWLRV